MARPNLFWLDCKGHVLDGAVCADVGPPQPGFTTNWSPLVAKGVFVACFFPSEPVEISDNLGKKAVALGLYAYVEAPLLRSSSVLTDVDKDENLSYIDFIKKCLGNSEGSCWFDERLSDRIIVVRKDVVLLKKNRYGLLGPLWERK